MQRTLAVLDPGRDRGRHCGGLARDTGGTLETWFAELVRRIMFIGFFLFVLDAGAGLGEGRCRQPVSDRLRLAVRLARRRLRCRHRSRIRHDGTGTVRPSGRQALAIVVGVCDVVVVVIASGLVAAIFLAVMLEMYVGLLAGMILLGFGGSSYTKDFAIRYLVYAFSVGMKIMVLVMIAPSAPKFCSASRTLRHRREFYRSRLRSPAFRRRLHHLDVLPPMIQGVIQGVSVTSGMEAIRSGAATSFAAAVLAWRPAAPARKAAGSRLGGIAGRRSLPRPPWPG